jgi:uncharacterized protein YbaA (DUF1428 family)
MNYVDGFLIPVPKKNLDAYREMAEKASQVWKEHGALDYRECVGDDVNPEFGLSFTKAADCGPDDVVIFSYIVYKSKAHRDEVNAKVMKDERLANMMKGEEMPFDCAKMFYGGFKTIVEA